MEEGEKRRHSAEDGYPEGAAITSTLTPEAKEKKLELLKDNFFNVLQAYDAASAEFSASSDRRAVFLPFNGILHLDSGEQLRRIDEARMAVKRIRDRQTAIVSKNDSLLLATFQSLLTELASLSKEAFWNSPTRVKVLTVLDDLGGEAAEEAAALEKKAAGEKWQLRGKKLLAPFKGKPKPKGPWRNRKP